MKKGLIRESSGMQEQLHKSSQGNRSDIVQADQSKLCDGENLKLGTLTSPAQANDKGRFRSKIPVSIGRLPPGMDETLCEMQNRINLMHDSLPKSESETSSCSTEKDLLTEYEKEKATIFKELRNISKLKEFGENVARKTLNDQANGIFQELGAQETTTATTSEGDSDNTITKDPKCMQVLKNDEIERTLTEMKSVYGQPKRSQFDEENNEKKVVIVNALINNARACESSSKTILNLPVQTLNAPMPKAWTEASIKPNWSGLLNENSGMRRTSVSSNDSWYSPRTEISCHKMVDQPDNDDGGDDGDDVFDEFEDCAAFVSKSSSDLD